MPWPIWWNVCKDRSAGLAGESGRTAGRVIHHVETGWAFIAELQLACDRYRTAGVPAGRVSHLVAHVHDEVIPTFVVCAEGVAALLGHGEQDLASEPVCTSSARFDRAVSIAALASATGQIYPPFRSVVTGAADALTEWGSELCTLSTALGRLFSVPTE